ncbi:hypothetical protein PQJ75_28735 [Rhodoplanes sp. TEM]|uniref:Uncharacterized protein n=1 Tax=Rhodoplanes tepidamans TaxID=200616 RepID=A0ABT5JK32_RHOTP|nr:MULTISPECIES: hypothetical protein [Rhodoplanes]MDC7789365.1 hypothetical protein [Rhodoplanes tepidamans]MDC7987740.1 hypothetical protein [Rhodoplanes sp. TEM]MDQ0358476.1 hypothetical protein [Rhodoplanes tepidamans]
MIRTSTPDFALDPHSAAHGTVSRAFDVVKTIVLEVGRTLREANRMRREAEARYPFVQF